MEDSEADPTDEKDYCPGCVFVHIMNPDGLGYCQEHGDIDGRKK